MALKIIVSYDDTDNDRDALALGRLLAFTGAELSLAYVRHSQGGALEQKQAEELLAGMPEEERMSSWHLVGPDGEVRSAGAGIAPLLRLLPGGSPLGAVAARTPRLMERGYRFVAGNRSLWGKLVTNSAKRRADRRIAKRLSLS